MTKTICGFVLGVFLTMPCVLHSEEVEIPLIEVINGVGPVDDPEQSQGDPPRPYDFRVMISGNSLSITNQNNSIPSAHALVMNDSTGRIVLSQQFTTSLLQQIAASGVYLLHIETANGALEGRFVVQFSLSSQEYYWYEGEKIPLQRGNQWYIIFDDDLLKESDKSQILESGDVFYSQAINLKWGITKPDAVIEDEEHVLYRMCSFVGKNNHVFFITHRFYVKLKTDDDFSTLQELANQYGAEIEEKDESFPLWYILRWGLKSSYNALELANIFYESGLFAVSEPEFMGGIHLDGTEDVQSTIKQTSVAKKYLRNGIIVIEHRNKMYNTLGVKIR